MHLKVSVDIKSVCRPLFSFVVLNQLDHTWVSRLYRIEVWQINKHKALARQPVDPKIQIQCLSEENPKYFANDINQYKQVYLI